MSRSIRQAITIGCGLLLGGCASMHSYVHPLYGAAHYEDLKRPATPLPVVVVTEFQRNHVPRDGANGVLATETLRVLDRSGVLLPVSAGTTATLRITANNSVDIWEARKAGFLTALSLGANGRTVDDDYRFTCSFDDGDRHSVTTYWHEIHTTAGEVDRHGQEVAASLRGAFDQVVQDVVLTCVKGLQDKGLAPSS